MLLDKISMIVILIIYIIFTLIALFTYLIIVGANITKSEEERQLDDEEQMKYLKEYEIRRKKLGRKNQ